MTVMSGAPSLSPLMKQDMESQPTHLHNPH